MEFKELLIKKDIHGAQLARKIGVSRSAVSKWITGASTPKLKSVTKLAEILEVSEKEILECFKKET